MNDTSPEIAEMIRQRYLAMSPVERLVIGARMFESARAMVVASLPRGLSPEETRRRICERFYGDLAEDVFGGGEDRVSVVQEQTNCFDEMGPEFVGCASRINQTTMVRGAHPTVPKKELKV